MEPNDVKECAENVAAYLAGIGKPVTPAQAHEVVALAVGLKNRHVLAALTKLTKKPTRRERGAPRKQSPVSHAGAISAHIRLRMNCAALQAQSRAIESMPQEGQQQAMETLKWAIQDAVTAHPALDGFTHEAGRGELWLEDEARPMIQVSMMYPWQDAERGLTTELVFTLRDHVFVCYVRTWDVKNRQSYQLAFDGDLDEDAGGDTFDEVVYNALQAMLAQMEKSRWRPDADKRQAIADRLMAAGDVAGIAR